MRFVHCLTALFVVAIIESASSDGPPCKQTCPSTENVNMKITKQSIPDEHKTIKFQIRCESMSTDEIEYECKEELPNPFPGVNVYSTRQRTYFVANKIVGGHSGDKESEVETFD